MALDPNGNNISRGDLKKVVDAVNKCGELTINAQGQQGSVKFDAALDDSLGDLGITLTSDVRVTVSQLPNPIEIKSVGYLYEVGGVGVSVTASGGLDVTTGASTPPNATKAQALAKSLEPKVRKVAGG